MNTPSRWRHRFPTGSDGLSPSNGANAEREALFRQFQACEAEKNARAQAGPGQQR